LLTTIAMLATFCLYFLRLICSDVDRPGFLPLVGPELLVRGQDLVEDPSGRRPLPRLAIDVAQQLQRVDAPVVGLAELLGLVQGLDRGVLGGAIVLVLQRLLPGLVVRLPLGQGWRHHECRRQREARHAHGESVRGLTPPGGRRMRLGSGTAHG
jgi:hypothetical protein